MGHVYSWLLLLLLLLSNPSLEMTTINYQNCWIQGRKEGKEEDGIQSS
jgi:hypothetical protein